MDEINIVSNMGFYRLKWKDEKKHKDSPFLKWCDIDNRYILQGDMNTQIAQFTSAEKVRGAKLSAIRRLEFEAHQKAIEDGPWEVVQ